ncbi:MAG TPA: OmpA family protein [Bacteroidetes bacterium]|nr:OmpA family protein [Bacteroidota bacterium]
MRFIIALMGFLQALLVAVFGQEPNKHEAKLYTDSTGQVFTRADAPAYIFIAPANAPEKRVQVPSNDKLANPMEWDGPGSHYIVHKDLERNMNIRFKILADGKAPITKPTFTSGLLFSYGNTYFAEIGSQMTISAIDDMSGVEASYISTDGKPFQPAQNPIIFSTEGEIIVNAYSVDNVGNAEKPNEFKIITSSNASIQLSNIYFGINSASLKPEAANEIKKLAELLKTYQDIYLEIRAHTDSRGDAKYNLILSQERAQAVVSFFNSKGIPNKRLHAKGFGENQPVNECTDGIQCPEEMHQANRRVELVVSKMLP